MKKNKNVKIEEDTIDLVDLLSKLWFNRNFILKITLLFLSIVIIYSLSFTINYQILFY